jgi:molybdopterin/thiamine biosynthesis adenylyltransferase
LFFSSDKGGRSRAVLVVGVGGLGAAAALELASRGIARIGLIDGDRVELSNLHRQLLHGPADIGRAKAETAAATLRALFPALEVEAWAERLDRENVETAIAGYDFVIDATDDTPTKFLLNDACVLAGKPFVHAGVVGLNGQLMTILPGETACLRCLFPEAPREDDVASCEAAGILGPLAALIGALEAIEAVKYLSGTGELAADRLLTIDARSLRIREIPLRRSASCPVCRAGATAAAEQSTAPRIRQEMS